MNNQTIYYTFQHRIIAKSPWLKPDEPLESIKDEWHNSNYDSFGFIISPTNDKLSFNELSIIWEKTKEYGFVSLNLAKLALKRLKIANEEGKFDYKSSYGLKEQAVRYEFRIVKVTHIPDLIEPVFLKVF